MQLVNTEKAVGHSVFHGIAIMMKWILEIIIAIVILMITAFSILMSISHRFKRKFAAGKTLIP